MVTVTAVCEDDCEGVHDNIQYAASQAIGLVRIKEAE